jgi:hypothetical protein
MSVYVVALVRNENEGLVKFKGPTMVCRLFAVNPGQGRGRNYVTIFCFPFGYWDLCIFTVPGHTSASSAAGGG